MSTPLVSRLWIVAAEHVLEDELPAVSDDAMIAARSRLRAAAITAEGLLNVVAGPKGATRSATVAKLVRRFGDHALDIHYMGAAFIEEAVASALVDLGVHPSEAARVADRCRVGIHDAAAALDTLTALTVD
jgi:hypothetical protein